MKATARRILWGCSGIFAVLLLVAAATARAEDKKPAAKAETKVEAKADAKAEVKTDAKAAPEEAKLPDGWVGASTCLSCHSDKEGFKHNIHAKALPNAKGVSFEQSCETCHGGGAKHAGAGGDRNNPDFATIRYPKGLKPAELSELCLNCHSGGKRMHWLGSTHEAKNVMCTNCHSVHNEAANEGKPPLLAKKSEAEVCYQCHAEKKAQIRKSAHMPLVEGKMGCTGCHNPHGTPGERLLAKASVVETCYQCHADKRGPFLWEHPPVRENCLNCHDPHGSHNDFMLVTKPPLLCQRCHTVGSGHPASDYGLDQEFSTNQVKMLGQACVNCHNRIHGSNHPGSGKRFLR